MLFVAGIWREKKSKEVLLSSMQVEQGMKRGEPTYLAALLELKLEKVVEISDMVASILSEFKGVIPAELLKRLPP